MLKKITLLCLTFLFVPVVLVFAQERGQYYELDPKPYDPETEVDMDMFVASWKESMPRHVHGSIIVRDIFTECTGDPLRPHTKGAVLTYMKEFCHGTLYEGSVTTPSTLKGEQKIFYIYSGKGKITAGRKTADLYKGIAVLIPEGIEFTMTNTGNEHLNMYMYTEPTYDGFKPRKDMLVRDENKLPITGTTGHWVNINKSLFTRDDGLAIITGVSPVWLEPMTMAQPHASVPIGADVLWIALEGDINTLLGKKLYKLPPGTCFKNPGDGKVYHANINVTDEPIKLLWLRTVAPK